MKKYKNIGVLTFHSIHNYGSILQAYALQNIILKIIDDKYKYNIIDLRIKKKNQKQKINFKNINNIFNKLYDIFYYKNLSIKSNKFEDFINSRLILSDKKYSSLEEVCSVIDNYDYLIAGSDEIWNVKSENFNLSYILPFNCKAKKISYSSSFGNVDDTCSDVLDGNIKNYLLNFDYLSVREKEIAKVINKSINKKCESLIDPVFLEDSNEWYDLAGEKRVIKGKYILYYSNGSSKNDIKVLKQISRIYKMKIVMINAETVHDKLIFCKKVLGAGPLDFLNLIKYAELVCTTSFYGTAFSIIFKKDFYCINAEKDERIKSLLNKVELKDRIININNISLLMKNYINFVKVENKLVYLKKYAIEFLTKTLDIK